MNDFLYGPQNINTFIEFHNAHHINYCEAIIYPNGNVEYCIPSHQETLIRISNIDKEEFSKRIFSCDEIMTELCNESNCIALWYNMYINPKTITSRQLESLKLLQKNNCINSNLLISTKSGYHTL